jgi:hypothetical protein
LIKLRVGETAVNPLQSQDFHLISTVCLRRKGVSIADLESTKTGELLQHARKRSSNFDLAEIPAHAEAEDISKIKDRLEALLFAETLQETLSPNADPGKWVNWRLSVLDA